MDQKQNFTASFELMEFPSDYPDFFGKFYWNGVPTCCSLKWVAQKSIHKLWSNLTVL